MTYAITSNLSLLQLPLVSPFDLIIARGLLELITDTLVAVFLLAGFGAVGLGVLPSDLPALSASVIAVGMVGCGIGCVNAVVNAFFKSLVPAVDWFLASFFAEYEPHWLHRSYLTTVAVLSLVVGLGLERSVRR